MGNFSSMGKVIDLAFCNRIAILSQKLHSLFDTQVFGQLLSETTILTVRVKLLQRA